MLGVVASPSGGLSREIRFYFRAAAYAAPDFRWVCAWLILLGAGTGLGLLSVWPMALLVDCVLGTKPDPTGLLHLLPTSDISLRIAALALTGLLLKLLGDLISVATTLTCNRINYALLLRVRSELFAKLQALSLGYHRSRPQGDAIYRLSSDAFGFQAVLGVLVSTLVAVINLVIMTVVLASRSAALTALAFSIAPLLARANFVFAGRFDRATVLCKEQDARLTTCLQRSLSSVLLVQSFCQERAEHSRFTSAMHAGVRSWWRLTREQIAYNLIVGTLFGLGGAAIFGYGGLLVHRGKLSVGDLMVFTGYLGMLWGPLCQLTGFTSSLKAGAVGVRRVFEVLDTPLDINDNPAGRPLPLAPRRIRLENLRFAYRPDQPILQGLTATICPGEMVAFVGESGVGKSTLLSLLPRFYDPASGHISLDGHDLRTLRLRDVRKHVAVVLQDTPMLAASVAENIAFGRPEATRHEIEHAAHLAGAHPFITDLPNGYDNQLTDNAANLSGGQRQRLAIARALLTQAPILVLDEPTSALDPHHEQLITRTLEQLRGRRTVILVSHRLSTVTGCDRIYLLQQGRVVEQGSHTELLRQRGAYWRLSAQTAHEPRTPALLQAS